MNQDSTRSTHSQHRKAFGPARKGSKASLARDIANAILRHRETGGSKWLRVSDYTKDKDVARMAYKFIVERVRPIQDAEAQTRRQAQQAWLDAQMTGIRQPDWTAMYQ